MVFRYFDGEDFNLAGPHGGDPIPDRRQWEAANPIEEASHGEHFILLSYLIAATTALVVLTAAWAV